MIKSASHSRFFHLDAQLFWHTHWSISFPQRFEFCFIITNSHMWVVCFPTASILHLCMYSAFSCQHPAALISNVHSLRGVYSIWVVRLMYISQYDESSFGPWLKLVAVVICYTAVPGLRCSRGLSIVAEVGPPLFGGVRASHCGGFACCGARGLGFLWASAKRRKRTLGLGSCGPQAGGYLPGQGSNLCPHWQADPYPLYHQEVP